MSTTRTRWLPAAQSVGWFRLDRHEDPDPAKPEPDPEPAADPADPDPDPEPDPVGDPVDPEPDPEPEGTDKLGDEGKKALDRMKAERAAAKKTAAAEKKRADDLARKVQEFEDAQKTESEKLAAKAERSAQQAAKAVARAVSSEVKVLAVGQFADPSDAVDVLMRDPSKYVDSDGEIDTDAIEVDLTDLLERKPHWAKPEPAAPAAEPKPKPKPDPGQGSRGAPAPVDYRTAPKDEVAAELAKFGYRQRV
ncbi:hypothetical protein [Streptomyces sp. NBC_01530]|uniref:hypothetical protein n=1 Tax=Streptomyces sp. NBC_01530 TaxID=2903895 RepID=UPI00386A51F9